MIAPLNLCPDTGARAQIRGRNLLAEIDRLREGAGAEMSAAFPGSLKRYAIPQLPESTISKARLAYACCPAFRVALCLLALRVGGADRARAQRLVDWLQAKVDEWWPKEEAPEPRQIVRQHQKVDAEEDVARIAYLSGEPGARELFLSLVAQRHAMDPELMRSLEQEARQG